jgi:hypothetical protein
VVLRLLVVKHLYNWSYADTERFVADSLVVLATLRSRACQTARL